MVKITREFSIIAARMIPLPGKGELYAKHNYNNKILLLLRNFDSSRGVRVHVGVTILSRHVRVSVFNKNDVSMKFSIS